MNIDRRIVWLPKPASVEAKDSYGDTKTIEVIALAYSWDHFAPHRGYQDHQGPSEALTRDLTWRYVGNLTLSVVEG